MLDNSSYYEEDSAELLFEMLTLCGVTLIFLPTYSPELNPCELVLSQIKRSIRVNRFGRICLLDEIIKALARVTHDHILVYYKHCIFPKNILPDLIL